MLSNAYFLAKFRFDTAENEPAKNLQIFARILQNGALSLSLRPPGRRGVAGRVPKRRQAEALSRALRGSGSSASSSPSPFSSTSTIGLWWAIGGIYCGPLVFLLLTRRCFKENFVCTNYIHHFLFFLFRVPLYFSLLSSFFSRGRFENELRKIENNIGTQL